MTPESAVTLPVSQSARAPALTWVNFSMRDSGFGLRRFGFDRTVGGLAVDCLAGEGEGWRGLGDGPDPRPGNARTGRPGQDRAPLLQRGPGGVGLGSVWPEIQVAALTSIKRRGVRLIGRSEPHRAAQRLGLAGAFSGRNIVMGAQRSHHAGMAFPDHPAHQSLEFLQAQRGLTGAEARASASISITASSGRKVSSRLRLPLSTSES